MAYLTRGLRFAGTGWTTGRLLAEALEHGTLAPDARTVLLIDEAGMADDAQLLKLLVAVEEAGAKAVVSATTTS